MRRAAAFSPSHITGFFEIHDSSPNPLYVGSRGAGVSLKLGVVSFAEAERSSKHEVEVYCGGRKVDFEVTKLAVTRLLRLANSPYRVVVNHFFSVPVGSGFGSSGAGALSAALAVNEALRLGLTREEAAREAHIAEVVYRTGLGDVVAQLIGGLEARVKPGGPGVGEVWKIPVHDLVVVCAPLGVYETRAMITHPSLRERINKVGARALELFLQNPSPRSFMELSARFAEEVGFINGWLKGLAGAVIEAGGLGLSVKKKVAFTLARASDLSEVVRAFRRTLCIEPLWAEVDNEGARLVELC
ncbi:MAG: GHMP kinase [Candidatus Nezhaarchaeota archaeon]|nr:GHMP kinase [Candidatus Nezhaarchaeota archaeon]